MPRLQELFTTSSAPEQILTDIYRTVTEAARVKLVGTKLLALRFGPGNIPGSSLNVVAQTKNSMTPGLVGEGAEVPIMTEDTYRYTLTPQKFGFRPLITKEMQEDSLFPVMERNLREAGYQMGRQLDRLVLAAARRGSGNTVTGGANLTIANLTTAINNLEANDHMATDLVAAPDVAMDLRNIDTFVEANKAGVVNPTDSLIGTIYGMAVSTSNNIAAANSLATAANRTDALVIDRSRALTLAEKRPLMVEQYNDTTRQLNGIVLTARWNANAIPTTDQAGPDYTSTAISLITTT